MLKTITVIAGVLFVAFVATDTRAETIAELNHLRNGEIQSAGFELTKGGDVDIEAVGMRQPHNRRLAVYAWIIKTDTREPVWQMTLSNTSRTGERGLLRRAEEGKFLEPGKYELYIYGGQDWGWGISFDGGKDFYDVLEDLIGRDDEDYQDWDDRDWGRGLDECFVRLTSTELKATDFKPFVVTGEMSGALVRFAGLGDSEYEQQGFTVDEPMNLRIYALVEHPRGNKTAVDYGWIVNAATRERVWEIDRFNTERAGGGKKNRVFNDQIRLEKGKYILHFVTDDSHSWDAFNMEPPYDPMNWGITLLPGTDFKASAFHLTDIEDERGKPLVDLTRARDNEYSEQAFELTRPATVTVYAIGEYDSGSGDFVDRGWIEDAVSGEVVWEMDRRNTEHAGGGEKNRMFDGPVSLAAGKYVAYYVTDDSHSYRDWNTGAPYDARAWGLAIYGGEGFDPATFRVLDNTALLEGTAVLARITRVRDDERRRERFTLDKETQVRIFALGEGQNRDMYDYGWIEDDKTGKTVWEMTYRRTDHAGGADKNRMCDETILLPAGTYNVYYETDGSHSFNDWNSAAPRHPDKWGITVSVADTMAKR
ncbi:MAG: hypothetical protein AB1772_09825 [Candidatus Zixiibacteriota bacterium]